MLEDGDFWAEKSKGVGIRECSCRIKYVIRVGLIEKMRFEHRLGGGEEVS